MQVRSGKTRMVLLTKRHAIKIAKPKVFRTAKRLLKAIFCWPLVRKRLPSYRIGPGPYLEVVAKYLWMTLLSGVLANRQEYLLSHSHPEYPFAAVLSIYLHGFIIVQIRGEGVSAEASTGFRAPFAGTNLGQAKHVCSIGEQLYFFDCGGPDAPQLLARAFND
jgi:hypothetical protein